MTYALDIARKAGRLWALVAVACAACAAPEAPPPAPTLTRDQLLDPQSCAQCHPDSFREWSGSMHAYAGEDPIFVAMNRKAQRESNGGVGPFCVRCHAPMAVLDGLTTDGLNLAELPAKYRGVTCYFCHSVASVEGTHNNPLQLSNDLAMRGGIADPVANGAHRSAYSPLHDRTRLESSPLCGSCHDIVTPGGAAIERTYVEWQASVFSHAPAGATCGQCHMPHEAEKQAIAKYGPPRWRHTHAFPGVDVALTEFPEKQAQSELVQKSIDQTLGTGLCVQQLGGATRFQVIIDNAGAGHGFPSGASPDRRAWVELVATKDGNEVYSSGVVAPGQDVTALADPDLWLMRDCNFDDAGHEVHQLWQALAYESNTLPAVSTLDPTNPAYYRTHFARTYPGAGRTVRDTPDHVRVRVHIQPVGYDVLDPLVASGDLAQELRDRMTDRIVGANATLEWSSTAPSQTWVDRDTGDVWSCVTSTNLNLQAMRTPAPVRTRCGP